MEWNIVYCLFCVLMAFSFYFFFWIISVLFYKHVYNDTILQKSQMLPFLNADGLHIGKYMVCAQQNGCLAENLLRRGRQSPNFFLIGGRITIRTKYI